jgi:hypothetical protein
MADDGFAQLTYSSAGLSHLDAVTADGVERITFGKFPPCEPDCLCSSLLVDGVLYGPATWQDCSAAMQRLPDDLDWQSGKTPNVVEDGEVREHRPFEDVQRLFAPPPAEGSSS